MMYPKEDKNNADPLWVSSLPDDEDPMPWQDMKTGVWHSIQHNLEGPHMCTVLVSRCPLYHGFCHSIQHNLEGPHMCTVLVFEYIFALEVAIGSLSCWVGARTRMNQNNASRAIEL
jgi:hypothetical protein